MPANRRILLLFFLQPLAFGAWLPRIPEVQSALGLDPAGLALALMALPTGVLLSLPFAGRLVARIGARRTIGWLLPAMLIAIALPPLMPGLPALMLALFFAGMTNALVELGLNVAADAAERTSGRFLMNTAHGFWSLGLMVGTLLGTLSAANGIGPLVPDLAIALIAGPAIYGLLPHLPAEPAPPPEPGTAKGFTLPHPLVLGICMFALGGALAEGAIADWGAIYMRNLFDTGAGMSGLAVTAFALYVALTRLVGDRFRARFGAAATGRTLALVGILGIALLFFAPNPHTAFWGFALSGIGAALAFPLAVTAAAAAPGRTPASNLATLSFIVLAGFMAGPVVIGTITQWTGIRFGLSILAPMFAIAAIFAALLDPRGPRPNVPLPPEPPA